MGLDGGYSTIAISLKHASVCLSCRQFDRRVAQRRSKFLGVIRCIHGHFGAWQILSRELPADRLFVSWLEMDLKHLVSRARKTCHNDEAEIHGSQGFLLTRLVGSPFQRPGWALNHLRRGWCFRVASRATIRLIYRLNAATLASHAKPELPTFKRRRLPVGSVWEFQEGFFSSPFGPVFRCRPGHPPLLFVPNWTLCRHRGTRHTHT